jgi:hypothetical protein
MVFNATFNNISVISWQSVLLVEETRVLWKTTDLSQIVGKLHHKMLYRVHLSWAGFKLTTLVVIGSDFIGSCKSNNHTNTTTMVPLILEYLQTTKFVIRKKIHTIRILRMTDLLSITIIIISNSRLIWI